MYESLFKRIAAASVWNEGEALELCQRLWPIAAKYDWHFGLTGSVLYKGTSTKDVDLIFYPHTGTHPTLDGLHTAMTEVGCTLQQGFPIGYEGKHVEVWRTVEGKRVDIILEAKPYG